MEKHGFVYIWYDRKHKRYYIGCHWGNEDDGYVCSSTWMRNAYKRRTGDFKRRILENNITNRKVLLEREYNWLKMIRPHELGQRYYNLSNNHFNHWTTGDENEKIKDKLRRSHTPSGSYRREMTESHKENISKALKGRKPWNKGINTGVQSKESNVKRREKSLMNQKDGGNSKGMYWWNNGVINKTAYISPGQEWVRGRVRKITK